MSIKIHIKVKNFIRDPYVVRIDHTEMSMGNPALSEFRKILTRCKKIFGDTWGYSDPTPEVLNTNRKDNLVIGNHSIQFNNVDLVYRSYWVFADDVDALQFRLSVGEKAKQIHIWPHQIKFTITEFLNDRCKA